MAESPGTREAGEANANLAPPRASDIITRVWEHALHEERIYNDRHNFFLVAEAMLFVFYATLGEHTQKWALVVISFLGVLLTIMWVLIAIRQEEDLRVAVERVDSYCEEYKEYKQQRLVRKKFRNSGMSILGRWVPFVIGVAWLVLIAEISTRPHR